MIIHSTFISVILVGAAVAITPLLHPENAALVYERTIDGDTFVASGRTIRLWGIDAPELDHPIGYAAKLYTQALVSIEPIRCHQMHIDRYKREVMKSSDPTGDIGAQLVKMGMAIDYEHYSKGYYRHQEYKAQRENRGIWKYGRSVRATPL